MAKLKLKKVAINEILEDGRTDSKSNYRTIEDYQKIIDHYVNPDFSFKKYVQGGFDLESNETELSFLKTHIASVKLLNVKTKEDLIKFLFSLLDDVYETGILDNDKHIVYSLYRPIFSSDYRQVMFLFSDDVDVFSLTFKCLPTVMENNLDNYKKLAKVIAYAILDL